VDTAIHQILIILMVDNLQCRVFIEWKILINIVHLKLVILSGGIKARALSANDLASNAKTKGLRPETQDLAFKAPLIHTVLLKIQVVVALHQSMLSCRRSSVSLRQM